MPNTASNLNSPPVRDRGTAGFVFWIVLYAVFLALLMAIGGGSRVLSVQHHLDAPQTTATHPA